jgi:hypothetical protein
MRWFKTIDKEWVVLQVVLPIFGPIVVSLMVVGLWLSLDPTFKPRFMPILDVGPWALMVYTVTLLFTSLQGILPNSQQHRALTWSMIVVAVVVTIYAGCMELRRQQAPAPSADASAPAAVLIPHTAYYVAVLLLLVSVYLCHQAYRVSKGKA